MKLQEGRFIQGLRNMFSLRWDMADPDEIHNTIISGAKLQGTNMCILMLAILIASIGLNMNSTAVIIGAMLISPLMGGNSSNCCWCSWSNRRHFRSIN